MFAWSEVKIFFLSIQSFEHFDTLLNRGYFVNNLLHNDLIFTAQSIKI